MTLQVPPLQAGAPIVDATGSPSVSFQHWWQLAIGNLVTVINRISRITSHTDPTTILTATDDGTTASIAVASHTRVYGDGTTLTIAAGALHGLTSNTNYALYYDDKTLANPSPTFIATTDIKVAQAVAADGRHFLGVIITPKAGSGSAGTRTGGGVYPAGSSVGGEL